MDSRTAADLAASLIAVLACPVADSRSRAAAAAALLAAVAACAPADLDLATRLAALRAELVVARGGRRW